MDITFDVEAREIFPLDDGPFSIAKRRKEKHWQKLNKMVEKGPLFLCGDYWFDQEMPHELLDPREALHGMMLANGITFPELPYPTCQFAFLTTLNRTSDRLVLVNAAFEHGYLVDGVGIIVEPNSPLLLPHDLVWLTFRSLVLAREVCRAMERVPAPDYSLAIAKSVNREKRKRGRSRVPFIDLTRQSRRALSKSMLASGILKSPHERRGHLRRLKSGKTIRVKASKIHGGAPQSPTYLTPLA